MEKTKKKKLKNFEVTIDMNWSEWYGIKAKTQSEAKKIAWAKFQKRLPKKNFTTYVNEA